MLQQAGVKFFAVPGVWRNFDYEAMARGSAGDDRAARSRRCVVTRTRVPEGDPSTLPAPPTDGDAVRWLYSTSGTTAAPKCVMHSDGGLIAGGMGLAYALEVQPDDVGSIAFPCTHIGGPDYLVVMLAYGMPAVLLETFDPANAVATFARHDVTMAGGSTAFYLAFLNEQRKDPSKPVMPALRMMNGGGAPKPPEVFREVRAEMHLPVCHGYGMTECPMITQGAPSDTDEQLMNTDGAPVHGCVVQIVDEQGAPVAAGVTGEVRVSGPMLAKGYMDPEATKAAFGCRRLLHHRRPRPPARRRPHRADRSHQGAHHPQGREHQPARDRRPAPDPPEGRGRGGDRAARPRSRRACVRGRRDPGGSGAADVRGDAAVLSATRSS